MPGRGSDKRLQGLDRAQIRVANSLGLSWGVVPVSVHSSVPKVPSSETENHRGYSHEYFKWYICWQNTNVVTQIWSHRLQRHLISFKIHVSCFAKLNWETVLLNHTLIFKRRKNVWVLLRLSLIYSALGDYNSPQNNTKHIFPLFCAPLTHSNRFD